LIEILTAREQQAWTPHDIYLRALLELYGDELELLGDEEGSFTPGQSGGITLTDFQRHGLRRALRVLERTTTRSLRRSPSALPKAAWALSAAHRVPALRTPDLRFERQTAQVLTSPSSSVVSGESAKRNW
jgi:hypothetical protein